MNKQRPRVFTWHIHGSYLYYLSQCDIELYIPVNGERTEGYYGRGNTFPFGPNVHEIEAENVREMDFDCILFQTADNYLKDQFELLSPHQRELPRIYLEHNTPLPHPVNSKHVVNDKELLLVHVTHFNKLMWDNNGVDTLVIEHGVTDPGAIYTGKLERGIVVINNLPGRGRMLGYDLFREVRQDVPLDLAGMGSEEIGLGEVLHPQLPTFIKDYRFFFNPIRYTSLGLAVCEALMAGLPVVALATTEISSVIKDGVNGFIHTDPAYLIRKMKRLLTDPVYACEIGLKGRQLALERFNIQRFKGDWEEVIASHISRKTKNLVYE